MSTTGVITYSAFGPGNYIAERQANGNYAIRDVPIFAEHERGGMAFDREWLAQAVEKDAERRREGYVAPLHIEHSSSVDVPKRAGHFVLTRVADSEYEGEPRALLYADLVDVPPAVFKEIKSGKLPYRSAEIHDFDKPEINSLALMQSKVPFFRFALLTVKDKKKEFATQGAGATFYSGVRDSRKVARAVYACGQDEYKEAQAVKYEDMDTDALLRSMCSKLDTVIESMASGEDEEKVEVKEDVTEEVDLEEEEIDGMLAAGESEEDMPPKQNPDSTPAEIEKAKKDGEYSAISARITALEKENKRLRDESDRREWSAKANETLSDFGISEKEIAEYAAKPAAVRDTWLNTTAKHLRNGSMPPRSTESYTTGYTAGAMVGNDSTEVLEYANKGAAHVMAARTLEAEWSEFAAKGGKTPKAAYIKTGLAEMGLE